ncbi:MAG TPA: NADP transhydrogenase subunit alpha [Sphingobium sp.]|nr:NADP transhydrogenase subunit alpha [Sphingobium sp.]
MSGLLLLAFLLAGILGAVAAWRVSLPDMPALGGILLILSTAGLAGALIVAAEAGGASARYSGLAALLAASIAFSSALFATRRSGRTRSGPPPS